MFRLLSEGFVLRKQNRLRGYLLAPQGLLDLGLFVAYVVSVVVRIALLNALSTFEFLSKAERGEILAVNASYGSYQHSANIAEAFVFALCLHRIYLYLALSFERGDQRIKN